MPSIQVNSTQQHVLTSFIDAIGRLDEYHERRRVWGPMQAFTGLMTMTMPGRATSYQSACGTVFDWAGARFGWSQTPDPAGLCRARARLTLAECASVWSGTQEWCQRHAVPAGSILPGHVVVGVDGTILHMPRTKGLAKSFGVRHDGEGKEIAHYPQALLVSAWDLDRRFPYAWQLSKSKPGERAMLAKILPDLPDKCVLLLDRGYPSRTLLGDILTSGRQFVVRMVSNELAAWPEVADFLAGDQQSAVIPVQFGKGKTAFIQPMQLVRRVFNRGRPKTGQSRQSMVVMASLVDLNLGEEDILRLYEQRWGIETIQREMKSLGSIERWHGKRKLFIQQEIYATMVWMAVSGVIGTRAEHQAQEQERAGNIATPTERRVNTRRVHEAVAYALEALFMAAVTEGKVALHFRGRANEAIRRMDRWVARRRPGRSAPRVPKHPYARKLAKR